MTTSPLLDQLASYLRQYPQERSTVERFQTLLKTEVNCFNRDCFPAHITGSAWIVDPDKRCVLLTHHRKIKRWFQPGGHSDGNPDTLAVAQREGLEETGLTLNCAQLLPLDLDIHTIAARGNEPEHEHFDVRYAFIASQTDFTVSAESINLAWVLFDKLAAYSDDVSMARMLTKWQKLDNHTV